MGESDHSRNEGARNGCIVVLPLDEIIVVIVLVEWACYSTSTVIHICYIVVKGRQLFDCVESLTYTKSAQDSCGYLRDLSYVSWSSLATDPSL